MSKNGCRYVPARVASVSMPRVGGVVTTKTPKSAFCVLHGGTEVANVAECVVSAFDLCDGFAIRLPTLYPSEWESESAVYSTVSASPLVRSKV